MKSSPNLQHSGFLVINKPKHMSSRQLVSKVSRLLQTKAGHTGTLDPLATGMMVLALGEATKFSQWIVAKDKAYRAIVQFGQQTSTDDLEGHVIHTSTKQTSLDLITKALPSFIGTISQVPPQFSAIHHEGTRSYIRARRGQTIDLPARDIHINEINISGFNKASQQADLFIHCQSGTYIRSIARDLGLKLGCYGHLIDLDRLWVSPFQDASIQDINHIDTSAIVTLESFFRNTPHMDVDKQQALDLAHGKTIQINANGEQAVFYLQKFIGIIVPTEHGTYKSKKLRPNVLELIQQLDQT